MYRSKYIKVAIFRQEEIKAKIESPKTEAFLNPKFRSSFSKAVAQSRSVKKVFLEISQNSQENTCARVSFLIKLQAACNSIKKGTLAQVFFCEFWETSKNTSFYRTPPVAPSAPLGDCVCFQNFPSTKRHGFL